MNTQIMSSWLFYRKQPASISSPLPSSVDTINFLPNIHERQQQNHHYRFPFLFKKVNQDDFNNNMNSGKINAETKKHFARNQHSCIKDFIRRHPLTPPHPTLNLYQKLWGKSKENGDGLRYWKFLMEIDDNDCTEVSVGYVVDLPVKKKNPIYKTQHGAKSDVSTALSSRRERNHRKTVRHGANLDAPLEMYTFIRNMFIVLLWVLLLFRLVTTNSCCATIYLSYGFIFALYVGYDVYIHHRIHHRVDATYIMTLVARFTESVTSSLLSDPQPLIPNTIFVSDSSNSNGLLSKQIDRIDGISMSSEETEL
jgi:hypothetical protein